MRLKHRIIIGLTVGLTWLTAACSPVKILNAVIPDDQYALESGVAYGQHARQKLDIYQPKQKTAKAETTIVFFYGGSWESGERAEYKFVAEALTSAGYSVVIPDYRLYPEVVFPTFVQDAALAMKWVSSHIADYGGDPKQIYLMGHSAGAQIAALLALDETYLNQQQLKTNQIKGLIGLAGPYDFLPLESETLKTIFGPEQQRWRSQPIEYVDGNAFIPPMLLLVGVQDETVLPKNSYHLAERVKQQGGSVSLVDYPDYDHIDMAAKLAKPLRGDDEIRQAIVAFIEQHRRLSN